MAKNNKLLENIYIDVQEAFRQHFVSTTVPEIFFTEGTGMSVSYFECVRKLPKFKFVLLSIKKEAIKTLRPLEYFGKGDAMILHSNQ